MEEPGRLPEDPCWRVPRFQKWALAWANADVMHEAAALQLVMKLGVRDPAIGRVCTRMCHAYTAARPQAVPNSTAENYPALGGAGALAQQQQRQQQHAQAALANQRQQHVELLERQHQAEQAEQRRRQEKRDEGLKMVNWQRKLSR